MARLKFDHQAVAQRIAPPKPQTKPKPYRVTIKFTGAYSTLIGPLPGSGFEIRDSENHIIRACITDTRHSGVEGGSVTGEVTFVQNGKTAGAAVDSAIALAGEHNTLYPGWLDDADAHSIEVNSL